ncbi:unnamed protein product [Prorocentrum cordatum]|uniref:Meiosis-specific nuclear structural protein 1 n=1 Tax=Prorocentrum cordatum TaxID=2364126 RepID=A0ABN9QR32_9DINO|nr:unnamed protein product [Polarella glacialis]
MGGRRTAGEDPEEDPGGRAEDAGELVEARRRNAEKRQADEAEKARRLAERQDAELQHFRERANKQNVIAERQRGVQQEKAALSNMVRQEREAGERLAQEPRRRPRRRPATTTPRRPRSSAPALPR